MRRSDLSFLEFLQGFRRGDLLVAADDRLRELLEAVRDTGGKGDLTIKMVLSMNEAGQLECVPDVSIKKPRRKLGTGIYYVTEDGGLSRTDPAQDDMFDELESRRSKLDD